MSNERVNPFADIDLPTFTTKTHAQKPVDKTAIDQIAHDQNFPSRQAIKKEAEVPIIRKRRAYITGRSRQLNFKATSQTAERFYAMADKRGVKLCELLELALDALEKQ